MAYMLKTPHEHHPLQFDIWDKDLNLVFVISIWNYYLSLLVEFGTLFCIWVWYLSMIFEHGIYLFIFVVGINALHLLLEL